MFIIWFGGLFGRLKGEFQQFNYVYVCISFTHPLYIKSQKLVYGYIIINVYTIFFGCWIICHLLYQLNCLQFSQLIVYIGFLFFCLFISIFGNYFVVFLRDSRILWLHDTIYFWFAVCLRGYYEFHSNVEILRFDKNTIPNFPVKQSLGQFWYNCGCFWPRKKIFKNVELHTCDTIELHIFGGF